MTASIFNFRDIPYSEKYIPLGFDFTDTLCLISDCGYFTPLPFI